MMQTVQSVLPGRVLYCHSD
uniref:Uncharacterized protein n=1 Tax=Anguilla anguilla TaxID=7936 RepID=A0A0E9U5A9_ANGAN